MRIQIITERMKINHTFKSKSIRINKREALIGKRGNGKNFSVLHMQKKVAIVLNVMSVQSVSVA